MLGYWGLPEETAAVMRGEWFLTGDLARFDADGYLWYEGRSDDQMNAFGYRVAPEEVEEQVPAEKLALPMMRSSPALSPRKMSQAE